MRKGSKYTAEQLERLRAGHAVGHKSPETRAKLSAAAKRRPPMSAETRALISSQSKGRNTGPKSEEHRAKIAATLTGRKDSESARAAKRAAWARRKAEGRDKTSDETKKKMSKSMTGLKRSAEGRANMSAGQKGKPGHAMTEDHKQRLAKLNKDRIVSEETRKKQSLARIGTPTPHAKREWYNGIAFHSTWEVRYAQALDALRIRWVYEPERFHLGDCTYLPDFYLPDLDQWHEVKGWMDYNSIKRIDAFRLQHPDKVLVLIMKRELEDAEHHATSSRAAMSAPV